MPQEVLMIEWHNFLLFNMKFLGWSSEERVILGSSVSSLAGGKIMVLEIKDYLMAF